MQQLHCWACAQERGEHTSTSGLPRSGAHVPEREESTRPQKGFHAQAHSSSTHQQLETGSNRIVHQKEKREPCWGSPIQQQRVCYWWGCVHGSQNHVEWKNGHKSMIPLVCNRRKDKSSQWRATWSQGHALWPGQHTGALWTGGYWSVCSLVKIPWTVSSIWAFCVNYKVNEGDIFKCTQILKSS